jgi:hypothetical protein
VLFESEARLCGLASDGSDLVVSTCNGDITGLIDGTAVALGASDSFTDLAMTEDYVYYQSKRHVLTRVEKNGQNRTSGVPLDFSRGLVATSYGAYWLAGEAGSDNAELLFSDGEAALSISLARGEMLSPAVKGDRVCTVILEPTTLECWTGAGSHQTWPIPDLADARQLAFTTQAGWACSPSGLARFSLADAAAPESVADCAGPLAARGDLLGFYGAHEHLYQLDASLSELAARAVASGAGVEHLVIAGGRVCWHDETRLLCTRPK